MIRGGAERHRSGWSRRSAYTYPLCLSTSPPCRRRFAPTASTAGCSTTSTGRIPIAARLAGLAGAGKMTTRRWYYLIPATGAPRALVHAIERHNLDALPGDKQVYAGRDRARAAASTRCSPAHAASRWSTRPTARFRTSRASTPARSKFVRSTASTSCRRAISSSGSTPAGPRTEIQTAPRRLGALYRVKDRAFEAVADRVRRGVADHRVRHPAADGRLVRRRGAGQRFTRRSWRSTRTPAIRTTCRARRGSAAIGARTQLVLLDLWGKLAQPGAVYADITWVGFTGPRVPEPQARAFGGDRRGARRGRSRSSSRRPPPDDDLRGWQVDRAARERARAGRATALTSCTGPGTASARRCTATACTWTTTRRTTTGACSRAPASRSNRACISTLSACAPRSTWSTGAAARR